MVSLNYRESMSLITTVVSLNYRESMSLITIVVSLNYRESMIGSTTTKDPIHTEKSTESVDTPRSSRKVWIVLVSHTATLQDPTSRWWQALDSTRHQDLTQLIHRQVGGIRGHQGRPGGQG